MEQIINITYDKDHQQPVVSSLQVAEDFNKQHKDVLESIRKLTAENAALLEMFYDSSYISLQNKELPMYKMNRDGFTLLCMGFTGAKALEWKLKYIQAFNAMEKEMIKLPASPMELLELQYQALKEVNEKVVGVHEELENHELNHELTRAEYDHLSAKVSNRLKQVKEVREWNLNPAQYGALKHGINGDICRYMGVRTRTMIARKDFEKACLFVEGWDPSSVTLKEIEDHSNA